MKKHLLFIVVLLAPTLIFSQDLISFKNGLIIYDCKITKEDSLNVYYQYNLKGQMISTSASKDQIQKCFYGDYSQISFSKTSFEFYQNKFKKYSKIQQRGKEFVISGALLTFAGIILYSTADNKYYTTTNEFGTFHHTILSTRGKIGCYCIIGGIPICAIGIILNSVASKNIKIYQLKLRSFSFNVNCNQYQQGLAISYHF